MEIVKANQSAEIYLSALEKLHEGLQQVEEGLGLKRWQIGKVLTALKESNKCTKDDYAHALEKFKIKEKTAYICERVAQAIQEDHAKNMGYTRMMEVVWPKTAANKKAKRKAKARNSAITAENLPKKLASIECVLLAISQMPASHESPDKTCVLLTKETETVKRIQKLVEKILVNWAERIIKNQAA